MVQFDFASFKALGEQQTPPIFAGIDLQTGVVMATMVNDKHRDFQRNFQCVQAFLMECGRVQAVLNNTILQSDQEGRFIALLKATATKICHRVAIANRHTASARQPERLRRTFMGQVTTLKRQLQQNNITIDWQQASNHSMVGTPRNVPTQQVRATD